MEYISTAFIMHLAGEIIFIIGVATIARLVAKMINSFIIPHTTELGLNGSIFTNCVKFIVYGVGLLLILQRFNISITPFITALGISGMAIALGLQSTLANLFSGFHLLLSRQVKVGEFIRLSSGEEGRIADIALRFTTLVTAAGNAIIIPNAKLADSILMNYSRPKPEVIVSVPVGVAYDSDLEKVERITIEAARQTMSELGFADGAAFSVRFNGLGDSAINFNANITTGEVASQGLIKHTFIKNLIAFYRKENIEIPFPVRTIIRQNP